MYMWHACVSGRKSGWICQPAWLHCGESIWMQKKAVSCLSFPTKLWARMISLHKVPWVIGKLMKVTLNVWDLWTLWVGTLNNNRSFWPLIFRNCFLWSRWILNPLGLWHGMLLTILTDRIENKLPSMTRREVRCQSFVLVKRMTSSIGFSRAVNIMASLLFLSL